jgi:hypothetical protein
MRSHLMIRPSLHLDEAQIQITRVSVRPPTVVLATLVLAMVINVAFLTRSAASIPNTLRLSRLSEEQVQRAINGPLVAYARQMQNLLPLDSCLQLIVPHVEPDQAKRPYLASKATVLSHNLYPRAIRAVPNARDGLLASNCSPAPHYVVIWMEPSHPAIPGLLAQDLHELLSAPNAMLTFRYTDGDGNRGYLFEVTPR